MSGSFTELDGLRIRHLLSLLDNRLRARGVGASIYVVGGAALTLSVTNDRRTRDIDVLASTSAVLEEADALARNENLPPGWLNQAARPWIPDPVDLEPPDSPGLRIVYAPMEHLLAMKLVALRRQDVPDIVVLAKKLNMLEASARDYANLLERVYGDEDSLQQLLGVPHEQVPQELLARGEFAARAVATER